MKESYVRALYTIEQILPRCDRCGEHRQISVSATLELEVVICVECAKALMDRSVTLLAEAAGEVRWE